MAEAGKKGMRGRFFLCENLPRMVGSEIAKNASSA
jgi:hypothetical protein